MEMYLVVFGFDMGPNVKFVSAFMDVWNKLKILINRNNINCNKGEQYKF